jgi:hypothetical protein
MALRRRRAGVRVTGVRRMELDFGLLSTTVCRLSKAGLSVEGRI